tara:strand:+ start:125 stop:388 length:264 start_codon:yes stop_codon:yes gene_type:complete
MSYSKNDVDIHSRTGQVMCNKPLPNILKLVVLFVRNYKYNKMDDSQEMSIEDQSQLIQLSSDYGELHLINLLGKDALTKHELIQRNK